MEAEMFLRFQQNQSNSEDTLNITFPGSYRLEFSLGGNVKDGDSFQGRKQGTATVVSTA